jgi:hypothetical protein
MYISGRPSTLTWAGYGTVGPVDLQAASNNHRALQVTAAVGLENIQKLLRYRVLNSTKKAAQKLGGTVSGRWFRPVATRKTNQNINVAIKFYVVCPRARKPLRLRSRAARKAAHFG